MKFRYLITETGKYNSLDPLDGDSTPNLPVVDLLYARPIEVNHDERFYSNVLSDFSYDPKSKSISLILREGIYYSDGSLITAEDIAFSIIRMAYTRPKFPMIRSIKGLEDWHRSKSPLRGYPEGIRVKGQEISIEFDEKVNNPLARLSLQLFSIIPKSCVDLETNAITCKNLPKSGLYEIVEESEKTIVFRNRKNLNRSDLALEIVFEYVNTSDSLKIIEGSRDKVVVATNETLLWPNQLADLYERGLSITLQPKSRFDVLYLVPKGIFGDRGKRRIFARKFRQNLLHVGLTKADLEGSIFTSIMPGYLKLDELEIEGGSSEAEEASIHGLEIRWTSRLPDVSPSIQALKMTIQQLGMLGVHDKENFDVSLGSTGFWPIDPMGDLQMLFTPGLHPGLKHIAGNQEMQKRIEGLQNVFDDELNVAAREFSRYMFEDAVWNIYKYNQRIWISNFETSVSLMTNTTSPWQFFVDHE